MQAVVWAQEDQTYQNTCGHGPQHIGDTTLAVAVELARFNPCRPGIETLARRLNRSVRTIKYHLGILRDTGLLAYRIKGTRVSGIGNLASEYVWTIPQAFDAALHLVTRTSDRLIRMVIGIKDAGRNRIKRLACTVQQLLRKRRPRRTLRPNHNSRTTRCTPMRGSSESLSTAGPTSLPPESKLETGEASPPTRGKTRTRRVLNTTGRRFQLARELIEQTEWLNRCSVPRIAWIVRAVADAGWTSTDVRAWLHLRGESRHIRRPSGFLATVLHNAENVLDTPAKRADAVAHWRASLEVARRERIQSVRHHAERFDDVWQQPASPAVRRMVDAALTAAPPVVSYDADQDVLPAVSGVGELSAAEVEAIRDEARARLMAGDTGPISAAIASLGREIACDLYGHDLVLRGLQLMSATRSPLLSLGT
ncbi:transcriptional regulator [Streptomyces venezuelae]|uniref:transcriptional regulator n=1 Tax=Streptomyces venezuelae TaxID=54571 RepID=UPI0037A097D0